MIPPLTTARKTEANRRNARRSTGPRTEAGKSIAKLNALRHGLNTPVPDHMVRACANQYRDLIDHVRAPGDEANVAADLVYVLAAHARLRARRFELMKTIVEASTADTHTSGGALKDGGTSRRGPSEASTAGQALRQALVHLGRLHSYERKSASRLDGLLKGR